MITVKMTVKSEEEVNVEFEPRSFYRTSGNGVIAIIDEDNVYRIFHTPEYSYISNGTVESFKTDLSDLKEKDKITEEEFVKLYNQALKSITLKPVMEYYAGESGIERVVRHI